MPLITDEQLKNMNPVEALQVGAITTARIMLTGLDEVCGPNAVHNAIAQYLIEFAEASVHPTPAGHVPNEQDMRQLWIEFVKDLRLVYFEQTGLADPQ